MNGENNNTQNNHSQETSSQTQTTSAVSGHEKNTLMGALSYIGPLVLVPFVTAKDDAFVKFHIKQGIVLFVIWIAVWFIGMTFWMLWPLLKLLQLAVAILSIIGIVNVVKGKESQLPIVGKFASHVKI